MKTYDDLQCMIIRILMSQFALFSINLIETMMHIVGEVWTLDKAAVVNGK